MTRQRTGSRIALPPNAAKVCASCLTERGNRTRDWHRITDADGATIGWTCPACPTTHEPIRLEKSGRFVAVVGVTVEGKRRQHKRRFDRLDDARKWVDEIRAGVTPGADQFTVGDLCDKWLAHRAKGVGQSGGIRKNTLSGYKSSLYSLRKLIGTQLAKTLTEDDIESALRTLATNGGRGGKGLSHRSVMYSLVTLRQVLDYAVRQRWLTRNPATLAKAPRKVNDGSSVRKTRRWTADEMRRFRAHVDTYTDDAAKVAAEPWLIVGMRLTLCGLRRSEVLGLDWSAVDLTTGTITVCQSRVKTGEGNETVIGWPKSENSHRSVDTEQIHPGTLNALRALWLVQRRPETGLVVRDAVGEPVYPDAFSYRFKTLCSEAGVPYPRSIHNVRHTIATMLAEAGVSDDKGAALLGHDVPTYRRFYVVADDDVAREGAREVGAILNVL